MELVHGIAYNSKGCYRTSGTDKAAYRTWHNMITRCYSKVFQTKCPTYIGCSVTEPWLDYQNFAEWFYSSKYSNIGYQLDKDLLLPDNKVYSPEYCCFVPQEINSLLLDRGANRGDYPQGVCLHKRDGSFVAKLRINGKRKHLGYFGCPQEAHQVYKIAKEANVKRMALEWKDRIASNAFDALMAWSLGS